MRCIQTPKNWISTQVAPAEPKTIGEHIKKERLKRRLLQKEVAKTLRVNIETLKNWERGVGSPLPRQRPAIIAFLGYNPEPKPCNPHELVRYHRLRLGLTQEQFGKLFGFDEVSIWRWESGRENPPEKILINHNKETLN